VGRGSDLAQLLDVVGRERLVTLVGPGGSGKTRLAIELGHRWCRARGEPAWFADLTALGDPSGLVGAAAAAAALRPVPALTGGPAFAALLAGKRALLVMDNAEHLLDATAELVDDILDAAPSMRLLVTSREPLGIDGEYRWPVGPLSDGPAGDALSLFVTRARTYCPGFPDVPEQLADAAALCADLDRLPLALELAAAHVGVLSPAELRQRLAVHGDLPAPAAASAPARPRTGRARWSSLGAALRWSTDALTAAERDAFRRLAVLPDSFSLTAAREVCQLADADALQALESLVRKSLLESSPTRDAARFRMLSTVRRHAAAELADTPASRSGALDGLMTWAVEQAQGYQRLTVDSSHHRIAMDLVDREQHNLRAALEWAADGGSAERGITVICCTEDWWRAAGHTAEAWARLRTLLDRAAHLDVDERTWLEGVTRLAVFAAFLDERAQRVSADLVDRARQRLERVADPELRLRLTVELTWVQLDLADVTAGRRLRDLLAQSRLLGGLMDSSILHYLAIWQLTHDDAAGALATAEACEVSADRGGNDVSRAHSAELYGMVLTTNGRHEEARDRLRHALDGMVSVDHLGCVLHCIESIAWWASASGRTGEARRLLGLTDALRSTLNRTRFSVERYAYHAALTCCGEPIPPEGSDPIGDALCLADDLVGGADRDRSGLDVREAPVATVATVDTRLSRPAWL
jgi:predicted ATPase